MEEAGVSHQAKRSGFTRRFQDKVHCATIVNFGKDFINLTALNDLTEAVVDVCLKLKIEALQKILLYQSLP